MSGPIFYFFTYFSVWVFFHKYSQITGLWGKGEDISLTSHYYFQLLYRHLDISWAISAESSPPCIANSWIQLGTFGSWVQVANH